jgi:hypothetical protein
MDETNGASGAKHAANKLGEHVWVLYYPYPQHNVRVSVESLMFQNAELRSGGSPSW